ncbi:MAG: hypothetical protein JRH20_26130 [Deltaproteobacteria bacterium]|nr:hypothetical protein [Deltaproteobacteria bacterium]
MTRARIPFSPEDEEKIASAGLWAIIAAVVTMASSTLDMVIKFINAGSNAGALAGVLVASIIGITITVILGIWLYQAGSAFRKIATTDVADERYLLEGFTKLRNYFMMLGILFIIAVSLFGLGLLAAVSCGMMFS